MARVERLRKVAPPAESSRQPSIHRPLPEPDDDMLNFRTPFLGDHMLEGNDLGSLVEETAKLARVLHLAIIGAIYSENHIGIHCESDLDLIQELANGLDFCAGGAERRYAELAGLKECWRRRNDLGNVVRQNAETGGA
jgi:hypothetical protein